MFVNFFIASFLDEFLGEKRFDIWFKNCFISLYPSNLHFLEEYIDSDICHLLDKFDEDNTNKNTEQPDKLVQNKSDYNDEEDYDYSYDEFDHDLSLNSYSTNIYSFYELFYIKVKENNNSILLYSLGEKYYMRIIKKQENSLNWLQNQIILMLF